METVQSINLIAINPDVRSGRPYLVGTTTTVADIAIAKIYHQRTPDDIAEDYELTLPQVYAALAFTTTSTKPRLMPALRNAASSPRNIGRSALAVAISLYLDENPLPS